jgi:chromate transport protein ChrA
MHRVLSRLGEWRFAAPASVALLALLSSATSLANGFVYDDRPIIAANPRVHTLARWWEAFSQPYWPPDWGDTNYRPLAILSYALQWAIGGGAPFVFHALNVVLYVGVCVAMLRFAGLVLPRSVAWLIAALFAVHPVHVEAVGNVVGQAELVVALLALVAVGTYVRSRTDERRPSARTIATLATTYAAACFFKETGFFILGLVVAAEITVVATRLPRERQSLRLRAADLWPSYVALALVAMGYLAARRSVLGGFGDDPSTVIAMLDTKTRLLTMLGVVPEWVRLLVWPARLSADYSPAEVPIMLGFSTTLVPAVVTLAGIGIVVAAGWTGTRVAAFGLLWVAVSLFPVSNIVLRSGVIVAERTLFLPSVGALLVVGMAGVWLDRRGAQFGLTLPRIAALPIAVILALGVARSASRQRVWRSHDEFHRRIVEDAPRSYRAHYMHGMWHFEQGRRIEGERHVRTAIALFPYDAGPYTDLADQYRESGLCAPARDLYRRAIALGPRGDRAQLGLVACLLRDAQFAEASTEARAGLARRGPGVDQFRRMLAIADSVSASSATLRQSGASVRSDRRKSDPSP